jgi:hypothetical protein
VIASRQKRPAPYHLAAEPFRMYEPGTYFGRYRIDTLWFAEK